MSRKWFTLGLLVFAAAACAEADDTELDELDTIETEEQTLPPPAPMDTTMMTDTLGADTMGDTLGM